MRRRRDDYIDPHELYANQAVEHYYAAAPGVVCPVLGCPVCRSDEEIQAFLRAQDQQTQGSR